MSGRRTVDEYAYTLGELLNHSTHHRGQVVLMLRELGHIPPDTDFRFFLTEARYGTPEQRLQLAPPSPPSSGTSGSLEDGHAADR